MSKFQARLLFLKELYLIKKDFLEGQCFQTWWHWTGLELVMYTSAGNIGNIVHVLLESHKKRFWYRLLGAQGKDIWES